MVNSVPTMLPGMLDDARDFLGFLTGPRSYTPLATLNDFGIPWGIDNDAFNGFDADKFLSRIRGAKGLPHLAWIVCPDAVGDCRETLSLFASWRDRVAEFGPVAFVGQNGQTNETTPWDDFVCLFLGGTTDWKLSYAAERLCREGKERGKWVHMGRVNSHRRLRLAHVWGCDSVDGTKTSRWSKAHLAQFVGWCRQCVAQKLLFTNGEE